MSRTEPKPSLHHTLLFDTVKTNVGGAYNAFSGIFTVALDGTYAFSFAVHVFCHAYASVEIVKNADIQGVLIADAEESCDHDFSSNTVIIKAVASDLVYVRTHSTLLGGDVYSGPYGRPTFSGWLIH